MAEKILIVDDDLDTLRLVGLMLQRQGYQIVAASSGKQGLEKAFSEKPDLILLDIMMPGLNGYEICRKVKANPETAHTYIIMVSARTQPEDRRQAALAGADEFVTKPFDTDHILERVGAALNVKPV